MVHGQRHCAGQEAGELVHLGLELLAAREQLADEEEVVGHGAPAQPLADAAEALDKVVLEGKIT